MKDARFFDPDRKEDDFGITIDYDGQWFHHGQLIRRDKLPILFATALHYDPDADEYWLVTPHEQGRVQVADVPYIVTDYTIEHDTLILITNLGHEIKTNTNNPIQCHDNGLPYVVVHNQAKARLNRTVREELIHRAIDQNGYDKNNGTLTLIIGKTNHLIAQDHSS